MATGQKQRRSSGALAWSCLTDFDLHLFFSFVFLLTRTFLFSLYLFSLPPSISFARGVSRRWCVATLKSYHHDTRCHTCTRTPHLSYLLQVAHLSSTRLSLCFSYSIHFYYNSSVSTTCIYECTTHSSSLRILRLLFNGLTMWFSRAPFVRLFALNWLCH